MTIPRGIEPSAIEPSAIDRQPYCFRAAAREKLRPLSGEAQRQLLVTVSEHVEAIHRTASAAPPGGGPAWDALLSHYQLAGVGSAEREATVRGMGIARGAVVAEVHMVLEALARWGRHQLGLLGGDPQADAELAAMPHRETARYQAQLPRVPPPPPAAPRAAPAGPPGLAAIFQNASSTSKQASWAQPEHQEAVLSCPHCGAPQQEVRQFVCSYCHRPLGG